MEILSVRILWDDGVYHRSEGYAEKERKNAEDHYMNFFKRKQVKKPKERNEITNKELKEDIANIALHILRKDTDYENLAYTKVEFGYLFDDSIELEEERRNCFVAITRTKKRLFMTYSEKYFGWSKKMSQFLVEMCQ